MSPGEKRCTAAPVPGLVFFETILKVLVEGDDIGREMAFVECPVLESFGVVYDVPLRGSRQDGLGELLRGLADDVENGTDRLNQGFVEGFLLATRSVALLAVTFVMEVKNTAPLNFLDRRSPFVLPIVRDVQNMLHEIIYAHENPMTLKILNYKLLVVVAIIFCNAACIELLILSNGRPFGDRRGVWNGVCGAAGIMIWGGGSIFHRVKVLY